MLLASVTAATSGVELIAMFVRLLLLAVGANAFLGGCGADDAPATTGSGLAPETAAGAPGGAPDSGTATPDVAGGSLQPISEGAPNASGVAESLPDLLLDADYLKDTTIQDFVDIDDECLLEDACVTGLGRRRIVRFGSRTANVGTVDLVVGAPDDSSEYYAFDSCTKEYQLDGYARYELREADSDEVLIVGRKKGFCMRDSEVWDPNLPETACKEYDCKQQGIGVGCADNYGSALQCQWVDITGLSPGTYDLRVIINADRKLEELDYANNVVTVRLEISPDDIAVQP
jgi:hypothetical protein